MTTKTTTIWTFAITSVALFMATLDNLVVTTALPVIRTDLGASIEDLEWTVNAYTLTFAVFLLTGAALGDRFGRRRLFVIGLGIFTAASVAAALAPSVEALIAARAVQGLGGAIVTPLTLTILSAAVPADKRAVALGAWSGIGGLAVAAGPLVGGAIVEGISWQWIFWLNVPIGLVLIPLAYFRLKETYGPASRLDLPGLALASTGLLGIVWGVVRGNAVGWSSPEIVGALAIGSLLTLAFVLWELRAPAPMLPMRFFRSRAFAAANAASLFMFFGMFGSIFLLAQFLQTVQGYGPFSAGLRILPWTLMPIFVAPIAGALSDRIGGRPLMATGLALQAVGLGWLATVSTPTVPYAELVPAFVDLRDRDGALLRGGRKRRPLRGAPTRGGPGLRREQRHPRAGRRVRRGGPRLRVHELRRLRVGPGLRRRPRPGRLGRSGRRRRSAPSRPSSSRASGARPRLPRPRPSRSWSPKPPREQSTPLPPGRAPRPGGRC